ncbi:MAG: hypothetical protein IJK15_04590 [Bacteroidaceae bacterium]|nr:hypothetical protein [Bacteroidaceae bacterium]
MNTKGYGNCVRCSLINIVIVTLSLLSTVKAQTPADVDDTRQSYTVRIVDAETGEALPLVGVYISEECNTLTNFDGEFTIKAAPTDVLRLTCIGRQTLSLQAKSLLQEEGATGIRVVKMKMLDTTLSEVTVKAVEGMLFQVAKKLEKVFDRKENKEAQYFYRQTSVFSQKQDIVEAFVRARSAVNLRELEFLTGRHGLLSQAAWNRSAINDMNLHHLLEMGPMTRQSQFWHDLIAPLRPEGTASALATRAKGNKLAVDISQLRKKHYSGIEYLQHFYDITVTEMDGDDQHLYCFELRQREDVEVEQPIMTGVLYVDRATLSPLAFDGQVENLKLRFGKGELRSATVLPVTFDVHMDYGYDRKFPEVADLSVEAKWGEFQTRTLLFNVEGQKHLHVGKIKKTHARENMLSSIAEAGYDSTFWANNEVVKRTAEEQAIAQGAVDQTKARLDSVAAYQASLPPLARLADRLDRFGKAIPQEKVFIHMDNTSYFLGDTIWFAAYTRRTNEDCPSRISRVLYAELWNHDGYLVERKLVEMKDGRGHGFFELPDTLYSGYFELRAYTRWQLNWGQTEHYHSWYTEYSFYNKAMAKDFFRDYEKLYSRVFPVYDKPKEAGDFYKDMTFRPLRRYFKSAPKEPELRLSLFPEGGNLVAGVPCRVAFEAATSEGEVREGILSINCNDKRVKIRDDRGEEVMAVRTENRGRSTFVFTPEEGKEYEAIFTPDEQPKDAKRPMTVTQKIKAIKAEGVALQVHRDSTTGDWHFDIAASGQAASIPLGLTVMNEGKLVAFRTRENGQWTAQPEEALDSSRMDNASQAESTRQHHRTLTFAHSDLPAGVNQVTVFDSIGHIYADRLFFVTRPELAEPTLQFTGAKEQYQPFERIDFDVTSAHLMPDQTVSLTVRDAVHADNTFDSGNIMTEMLLASEIKGFVPQPNYFFERDDEEHRRALDLLMLTQGWRRFNWQEMAVKGAWEITHPAEHTQIVTGTVNRYYSSMAGFDPAYDAALAQHEEFMLTQELPLSEQWAMASDVFGNTININGQALTYYTSYGNQGPYYFYNPYSASHSIGNRSYGWNLNAQRENLFGRLDEGFGTFGSSTPSLFQPQRPEWRNDDYNVLSFRTANRYRESKRSKSEKAVRQYLEEGSVTKDVTVHAEFVNPFDQKDVLTGETQTQKGRFQIDLPRFEGQCIFFLGASDSTKWKKNKPYSWVTVDPTDEYSRSPLFPEYYVRLNFPYPRWVKPYTYYQVHNAPLRDSLFLSPRLLTDGIHTLDQVTVRARHGGLRRIDYSKPAYVIDAYVALNLAMDAGLIDYSFNSYEIASKAAFALIGDMGMERNYSINSSFNSKPGIYTGYLDQRRQSLLTYVDKIYIYTDYSPRREGDERFEQANQPNVRVDLRGNEGNAQRVTYRDRRYILDGFAFQEDFYHPDYKRNPPVEGQKDYRRTLYWNPELKLDASGKAHVSLYNNSQTTTIAIDAAGQTAEGGLLYK